MKTKFKMLYLLAAGIIATTIFFACQKEGSSGNNSGNQKVSIYLTDGPGLFDHVYIDIQSVEVLVDTCSNQQSYNWGNLHDSCVSWQTLSIRPGVYDLLTLTNGTDTLLASGSIPSGKIFGMKITLGTNNSLVKDSVSYPLNLYPGENTILLRLKGNEFDEYLSGHLQVWLDFDVTRSIVTVRNNEFYLRPFIRLFTVKMTGSIEGKILPRDAYSVLTVYNNQDTAYAIPGHDGEFKVRGLDPGTYSVFVNASNGYQDTTINNVTVQARRETDIGTVTVHH